MNVALLISFFYISFFFQSELSYQIDDLRKTYYQATKDKKTYEQLAQHLARYKGNDALVQGFQAGIQGVGAKYAIGFYSKLKHVRNATHAFEKVIKKDPHNPEVRFLRYTIEYHIPRYLLMSGHLQEDKKIVFNGLLNYPHSGIDTEVFKLMREYFLRGDHSTEEEKKQLRNLKV